jgi:hypothetical protein
MSAGQVGDLNLKRAARNSMPSISLPISASSTTPSTSSRGLRRASSGGDDSRLTTVAAQQPALSSIDEQPMSPHVLVKPFDYTQELADGLPSVTKTVADVMTALHSGENNPLQEEVRIIGTFLTAVIFSFLVRSFLQSYFL